MLNGDCRLLQFARRPHGGVYTVFVGKQAKIGTANTNKGIQRPVLPKPEPETPPVPAYEPPKDMIPPSLLKQVRGRRLRAWKEPSSRAELNTMPVPYPFSEIADAPYNRGLDETPEETGRVIRHTKNR